MRLLLVLLCATCVLCLEPSQPICHTLTCIEEVCQPQHRLQLRYDNEIGCQILATYAAQGFTPSQLRFTQTQLPIIYPWDTGYEYLRNNYNRKWTYWPQGIIMCQNVRDVQRALHFVRHFGLEFRIRSGGHAWLPFSLSTGIIIDLSGLNTVDILWHLKQHDEIKGDKYAVVGPGTKLGVLIQHLSDHHLAFPVGSCINVAVGGLSLGAGLSPSLIRLGGLMLDHLVEAEVVLVTGDVVRTSETVRPDLFFGLRGAGGGNFGIVTQYIFRPCWFTGAVGFTLVYPRELLSSVITLWQDFAPFTNRRLNSQLSLAGSQFTKMPIQITGQFEGPRDKLLILLHSLIALARGNITLIDLPTFADAGHFWGTTSQSYAVVTSIFWYNRICPQAVDIYLQFMNSASSPLSRISFNAMQGRVADFPANATAFPHRQALFWNDITGATINPTQVDAVDLWANQLYMALVPHAQKVNGVTPGYVNAPQVDRQYLQRYYADNVAKLLEVKKRYDPDDVFHFPQSIPVI